MLFTPVLLVAAAAAAAHASSAGLLGTPLNDIIQAAAGVNSPLALTRFLGGIATTGTKPTSVPDVVDRISSASNQSENNPFVLAGLLKKEGLLASLDFAAQQLSGCGLPCTDENVNLREPLQSAYNQTPGDAPWSLSESQLRAALYIPPDYSYGTVTPIIFVPGTGNYGKQTFFRNMGKKFAGSSIADPVYLNVPGYLLNDAQTSAEYVAYAVKYISGISQNEQVAVMTWSQGSVDTHWAMKYWPSARSKVADVINISADYDGSPIAIPLCLIDKCTESLRQQLPQSSFLATLHSDGGKSAYVPTTSIMSLTDFIVPQLGGAGASGFIEDERNVGVTNAFIQEACALQLGGGVYTHEGALFSNLAYDLAVDAITHNGPGKVERLDLARTCSLVATEGLSVQDIIFTTLATPQAIYNILVNDGVANEPPIRAYARQN